MDVRKAHRIRGCSRSNMHRRLKLYMHEYLHSIENKNSLEQDVAVPSTSVTGTEQLAIVPNDIHIPSNTVVDVSDIQVPSASDYQPPRCAFVDSTDEPQIAVIPNDDDEWVSEDECHEIDTDSGNVPNLGMLNAKGDVTKAIRRYAISANLTLKQVNMLLRTLRPFHPELPLDARTLLRTPRHARYTVSEIKLQQKELSVIPNLKDFSDLKILDVSSNRIKNLQFCSSNLNLVTLLVYDNEIVDLTGLCQLKNLSVLHAQYNAIKNIDTCFYNLAHLTDLRLDDNEIEKVGVNALRQCTVLTNLDLSYNSIENVEFLADLPNLAYLTMTHNRLKSIKPLTRCPKLNELDVSDNSISEHGLGEDGFLELERLNLSNNEVTKISGDIQIRGTLTALILSGNQLAELPEMGKYFPNLDILEISENKFQYLDDILNSICGCENLRELSIKGNPFECEDDTVSVLARTIKKQMPNVSCLNGVSLEMVSEKVMPSGSDRTRVRQKDIYEMIESQLSHLSTLTTPLEESFEKSFNALQEVLGRLEVQECTEQSNVDEQATPADLQAKQEEMHGFPVSSDQGDVESEGNQM